MVRQSGGGGGAMILTKYGAIEGACPVALRCTSSAGRSDKQKIESKNRGSAVQLRENRVQFKPASCLSCTWDPLRSTPAVTPWNPRKY